MMTSPRPTAPRARQQLLLVTTNDLLARAIVIKFRDHYDVTVVASATDALGRIAIGRSYRLVIANLSVPCALELHAAIARRDPSTAGHMAVIPQP